MNPMDTAPRDGTRFMARWPEDPETGAPELWLETWAQPDPQHFDHGWHCEEGWCPFDDLYAPTEWRPL